MTPTPKHKTAHSETSARTIVLSRRNALGLLGGGAGAAVALGPLLDRSVVLAAARLAEPETENDEGD